MTSFFEKLTYNLSDGILTKKYKDCNIQLMIQKKEEKSRIYHCQKCQTYIKFEFHYELKENFANLLKF